MTAKSRRPWWGSRKDDSITGSLGRLERRDWYLWSAAVVVTLVLAGAVASFLLRGDYDRSSPLPQAVPGLVALVLIFDIYTLYQQLQLHRIRRQLIRREELFRLISENAADLIAVVDINGRRLYNSLSYKRVLGYSPEELQDSTSFEQVHPEDQPRVKAAAEEARRSGIGRAMEYRIRHKDGSWRVLESSASVIRDSHGQPDKLIVVNRDITERKRTEEALRRSEANFRSVIEDAPYGIYRASPQGRCLLVNPALVKMLGYDSAEELLQVNLTTDVYVHSAEHQRLNQLCLENHDFKDLEVEWKRKDGTPMTARCGGRSVADESGNVLYFEVFSEDVSQRRVLERQLRMAQKMEAVGRLSGGIAHDFNNLLGVIIGYIEVIKRALGSSSPLYEHAVEVEKASQRAVSLTRQLLAFSRMQILEPAIINLNTLVSDTQKMLGRLIGEDIEVHVSLDPDLGQVKADQGQIEQVLLNLAVNARDAMPEGGKLILETRNAELDAAYTRHHPGSTVGSYVMLGVTDTGTGIDPEIMPQIFEPFFTTKERGKGTGLGLATVYGVVKQSGGYIAVDSEKGKSTSFQVFLPRVAASELVAQAAPPPRTLRGCETILLAEDAEPLRKLAQLFLEQNGYHVLSAPDGAQALQLAQKAEGPIHLLLTDVIMPGMNGRALADRLAPGHPAMKVLYMSGYSDSFIAGHGVLEAGMHLLHKPFTEENLIRKVRDVLDGPRASGAGPSTVPALTSVESTSQS